MNQNANNSAAVGSGSLFTGWMRLNAAERVVAYLVALVAVLVIALYRWTEWWPFFIHQERMLVYGGLAFLVFLYLLARLVQRGNEVRHSLESIAALLTAAAILGGGYWFFYERPGVPKLTVGTSIQAWPIGNGKALVRTTVELQNVGSTVIEFDGNIYTEAECVSKTGKCVDERMKVDVGQVFPVPTGNKRTDELLARFDDDLQNGEVFFDLDRTYFWPLRAKWYQLPVGEIEAGETDRHYFKAVVPCIDGLVLASTVRVPKKFNGLQRIEAKGRPQYVWVSQSTSDPIEKCI